MKFTFPRPQRLWKKCGKRFLSLDKPLCGSLRKYSTAVPQVGQVEMCKSFYQMLQ